MSVATARSEAAPLISGCDDIALPRNDDSYSNEVSVPFPLSFGGQTYNTLRVNNNGNVTFTGGLSTYTPFGIRDSSIPIIAPFFADVDTRGSGSEPVRYSVGSTSYKGRRAFCVNWVNVGYYPSAYDKTNSFQLLLVDRGDVKAGAFDIVFNYQRIQWETGSASGGSNGFGGTSAAVGFSDGLGSGAEVFEFNGSRVPGSFLDSGSYPLIANTNAAAGNLPGRYLWRVRGGAALTEYVALGDSFASGEGAGDYDSWSWENGCHRSRNAYPNLLVDRGTVNQRLKFVACSGAKLDHFWNDFKGEVPQRTALGDSTGLVTISMSGNDLGFGPVIRACLENGVGSGVGMGAGLIGLVPPFVGQAIWSLATCKNFRGSGVTRDLASLRSGDLRNKLKSVFKRIKQDSKRAKVVVVTYPQFFQLPSGVRSGVRNFINLPDCDGVRFSDQQWINSSIHQADQTIADLASSYGLKVAGMSGLLTENDSGRCGSNPGLNGIRQDLVESFHPNQRGHSLMADRIGQTLGAPSSRRVKLMGEDSATTSILTAGQTVTRTVQVDGSELAAYASWEDGAASISLTSPSGVIYSGDSPGNAEIELDEYFARIEIANPEAGQWTLTVTGGPGPEEGTAVTFEATVATPAPKPPAAVARLKVFANGAVEFNGSDSRDPAGGELAYTWDFGDQTGATGAVVRHRYAPGTYVATLTVTNSNGEVAVETVPAVIRQNGDAGTSLTEVDSEGNRISATCTTDPRRCKGAVSRFRWGKIRTSAGRSAGGRQLRLRAVLHRTGPIRKGAVRACIRVPKSIFRPDRRCRLVNGNGKWRRIGVTFRLRPRANIKRGTRARVRLLSTAKGVKKAGKKIVIRIR